MEKKCGEDHPHLWVSPLIKPNRTTEPGMRPIQCFSDRTSSPSLPFRFNHWEMGGTQAHVWVQTGFLFPLPLVFPSPLGKPALSFFLEAEQKREERKKVGKEEIKEKVPEGRMTKSTKTLGKRKLETGIKLFYPPKFSAVWLLTFFFMKTLLIKWNVC